MEKIDYSTVIVKKPWGSEYLCYRNGDVAIWLLNIQKGEKTSMHCHPTKNTGLVVLQGEIELSFIRNRMLLTGLDKIHIFRARFHSSAAISDAFLFEVESPEDKEDLIRLDDNYGREEQGYEGREFFEEKTEDNFWLKEPRQDDSGQTLFGCRLRHISVGTVNELELYDEKDVLVFTKGGVITGDEKKILFPGDIVDGETLGKIAPRFSVAPKTSIIHLRKNEN